MSLWPILYFIKNKGDSLGDASHARLNKLTYAYYHIALCIFKTVVKLNYNLLC